MSCSRGKAHPNAATKLRLFTDSAGYCQRCNTPLFPDEVEGNPHIAELAHIFAANDGGPRARTDLTAAEKGAYENIILLCANCHTLVDKAPDSFPGLLMAQMKRDHVLKIQRLFGAAKLTSRAELRGAIRPLLDENATIHRQTGPDNEYRFNPEASEATAWKLRVRRTIIPNSLKALMLIDANQDLLTDEERITVEEFRYHVQGLVMRHIEGADMPNSRFPTTMATLGI